MQQVCPNVGIPSHALNYPWTIALNRFLHLLVACLSLLQQRAHHSDWLLRAQQAARARSLHLSGPAWWAPGECHIDRNLGPRLVIGSLHPWSLDPLSVEPPGGHAQESHSAELMCTCRDYFHRPDAG